MVKNPFFFFCPWQKNEWANVVKNPFFFFAHGKRMNGQMNW